MNKKLLKSTLLSFALLITLFYSNKVSADQNCKVYKDYYYFLDATDKSTYVSEFEASEIYRKNSSTFVPAGEASNSEMIDQYQIEILKEASSITDEQVQMDLNTYYTNLKKIKQSEEKELTIPNGKSTVNIYKELETEENVVRHILHGKWYTNGQENENIFIPLVVKRDNSELINSSIIATGELEKFTDIKGTGIKFEKGDKIFNVTVERSILESDIEELGVADLSDGGNYHKAMYIAPAVYYIEYEYCSYTAQIDYVKEGTEVPIKEEDKLDVSYTKSNLEDGFNETVTSPDIEGCVTKEKEVDVKIDGEDFYEIVEYSCDVPKSEQTGDTLIYVAWIVGLGALGYSVYYFMNLKKQKSEY